MSKQIQVFLLEDVASVGKAGEIASVSEGFARNMLFPQGKAALASPIVKNKKVHQDAKEKAAHAAELAKLRHMAEVLEGKELTLGARIKEGNDIFGSISAIRIADELNKQANLKLKPKNIELKKPITAIGDYKVAVNLSPDVTATIHLTVNGEGDPYTDDEE